MAKYRKRPVIIDAVTWNGKYTSPGEWPEWFNDAIHNGSVCVYRLGLIVKTLEGEMQAGIGDKIICGVKGEIYPCKPDIFDISYEPVVEDA